jgi:hypothetical protein
LTLHEGKYALRTSYAGQQFNEAFWINTERTTSVTFNAAKLATGNVGPVAAHQPPATAPSPPLVTGGSTRCRHSQILRPLWCQAPAHRQVLYGLRREGGLIPRVS